MKKLFSQNVGGDYIGKLVRINRVQVTVEEVIAEGGFSTVFLCKSANGQKAALKRMFVNSEEALDACKQEIDILKHHRHKNIVRLIDSNISQSLKVPGIYEVTMLMEYCRAGHVVQLMNQRIGTGFSQTEVLQIFCDILEAVAQLHHATPPILHRDLKVENILRHDRGNYILCDFGSATTKTLSPKTHKIIDIEEDIQKYTTLSYRAPEMIDLYKGHDITTKTDIWALGCILYKLCYFSLPFGESTLSIQHGKYTFPGDNKYSDNIQRMITYMLQPNPDLRPDIFQVAHFAFKIANQRNTVPNRNSSVVPRNLPAAHNSLAAADEEKSKDRLSVTNIDVMTETSITPRKRPQGKLSLPPKHSHVAESKSDPQLSTTGSVRVQRNNGTSGAVQQVNSESYVQNVIQPQIPLLQTPQSAPTMSLNSQPVLGQGGNLIQMQSTAAHNAHILLQHAQLIQELGKMQQQQLYLQQKMQVLKQMHATLQSQLAQQPALAVVIQPKVQGIQQEASGIQQQYTIVTLQLQKVQAALQQIMQMQQKNQTTDQNAHVVMQHGIPLKQEVSQQPRGVSQQQQPQAASLQLQGVSQQPRGVSQQQPQAASLQLQPQAASQQPRGVSQQLQGVSQQQQQQAASLQLQGVYQQQQGVSQQPRGVSQQPRGVSQQPHVVSQHPQGVSQQQPQEVSQQPQQQHFTPEQILILQEEQKYMKMLQNKRDLIMQEQNNQSSSSTRISRPREKSGMTSSLVTLVPTSDGKLAVETKRTHRRVQSDVTSLKTTCKPTSTTNLNKQKSSSSNSLTPDIEVWKPFDHSSDNATDHEFEFDEFLALRTPRPATDSVKPFDMFGAALFSSDEKTLPDMPSCRSTDAVQPVTSAIQTTDASKCVLSSVTDKGYRVFGVLGASEEPTNGHDDIKEEHAVDSDTSDPSFTSSGDEISVNQDHEKPLMHDDDDEFVELSKSSLIDDAVAVPTMFGGYQTRTTSKEDVTDGKVPSGHKRTDSFDVFSNAPFPPTNERLSVDAFGSVPFLADATNTTRNPFDQVQFNPQQTKQPDPFGSSPFEPTKKRFSDNNSDKSSPTSQRRRSSTKQSIIKKHRDRHRQRVSRSSSNSSGTESQKYFTRNFVTANSSGNNVDPFGVAPFVAREAL